MRHRARGEGKLRDGSPIFKGWARRRALGGFSRTLDERLECCRLPVPSYSIQDGLVAYDGE